MRRKVRKVDNKQIVFEVATMMRAGDITSKDIRERFGIDNYGKYLRIVKGLKKLYEFETYNIIMNSRNVTAYHYIGVKKDSDGFESLPKVIRRDRLIDWFIKYSRDNQGMNVKKLYKLASEHGIKVYMRDDYGKVKYLN